MKEVIENAKRHLQYFIANLEKRINEGAWSGMIKNYEGCAPGSEYGGTGLAISLENMEEEVLVVYLPNRICDDSIASERKPEYRDAYNVHISKIDCFLRNVIGEQMEYIEEQVGSEAELCDRVFKTLDLLYETKKYLTGSDFSKYELNSDIEIDEYGVLYYKPKKLLLRCINPYIEEYWVKEGTLSINDNAFKDLEHLKTLVLPESLNYIAYNGISNCKVLQTLVIKSLDLNLNHCNICRSLEEPLTILGPEEFDKNNISMTCYQYYIFDARKMKRNVISPKNDNCTYRELKQWLETLSEEQLDEKIYVRSNIDSNSHPFHKHTLTILNQKTSVNISELSGLARKFAQLLESNKQHAIEERRKRLAESLYKIAPDTVSFEDVPTIGLSIDIDSLDLYEKRRK